MGGYKKHFWIGTRELIINIRLPPNSPAASAVGVAFIQGGHLGGASRGGGGTVQVQQFVYTGMTESTASYQFVGRRWTLQRFSRDGSELGKFPHFPAHLPLTGILSQVFTPDPHTFQLTIQFWLPPNLSPRYP